MIRINCILVKTSLVVWIVYRSCIGSIFFTDGLVSESINGDDYLITLYNGWSDLLYTIYH